MVTKGIIKSIDYNGNTCKVRVPILESACDDAEIVLSAIFATAPGIFNGYKEEDVVIVSFEDNNYENAIILGKLYLGASKENEDPRGTVSCANLKSENQATIPLSSKLVYDAKDKNTANVKGSYNDYKTLADIVDGLQTQKTEIGSLNVKIIDDGENLGAEIAKKVSITDEATKQRGLGWNLNTEKWEIYAKDTVGDTNSLAKLPIMTIDRTGMSIAGDLKLNGYPRNITVLYAQNGSDKDYPYLYKFKQADFPDTEIDKTWYYNKYIKIIEADKEKYILISNENIDDYTITPGETVAYVYNLEEINIEWKTETPARVDGQYIWQWTHTESFSFNGDEWTEQDNNKVVCITGATGSTGEPATIYWASFSTAVHTGKNQASNIEIIPYAKTGNAPEVIDTTAYFKYSLDNGTTWNSDNWTLLQDNKIIILAKDIIADNIIVKLAHARTDQEDSTNTVYSEYETETITYSPLNTPVLDLNNDSAALNYTTDGTKINANDKVSSTATLYLNGEAITTACYIWYLENCTTDIAFVSNNKHLITNTISINGLKANAGTATCLAFKDKDIKAVVVRSAWSEADWTNFSTGEQTWTGSDALEENEYFVVIGRATDSKKFHVILGQAIDNINGEIRGKTVSYDKAFTKVFSITKQLKGDTGDTGVAINNTKQWYILWPANDSNRPNPAPIPNNTEPKNPSIASTLEAWMSTPPEAVNDYVVWTCYGSIFSDDVSNDPKNRHITYSTPVKDNAYALAQGKTTNYYSPTEPVNKIKMGDCWFDTGYVKLATNPENKAGYLGKFVVPKTEPIIPIPEEDKIYVKDAKSDKNGVVTRYIPIGPDDSKSTYLIKITPKNIDNEWFTAKIDNAYETGNLKQCSGFNDDGTAIWTDIAGELVTNKLTANYINALDITTKKIHVNDTSGNTLFKANGIPGEKDSNQVTIGGFEVDKTSLSATIDTNSPNLEGANFQKIERSFDESVLINTGIADITTGEYASLDPTTIYCHNAGDLIALATDQESFNQIYKDTDLLKELETRPWLEFSVKASNSTSQYICIYNSTTLDDQDNTSPINDIWDIYSYDDATKTWKKDTSDKLITNVITHYKAQVYVGTDRIEVTNGDKIVKLQNGNLFANSADISGTITATSGNIGGFKLQNKDLIAQQSSEDDIVPLVSWFGTPLADKRIWNATLPASENTFTVSETISGWEIKYIYYEYNEEAPTAFDATGTPTKEQIKSKLTLYLVVVINNQTTQAYKFKTTVTDYSIWEQKELNDVTTNQQFIATKIPVDISNSSLATTRVSPKELFIGYEKEASTGYDSNYWFTLTPEMLKDSSIDIDSLKDSQLYEAIFKKPDASGNGTPWSNLKFSLKEENPSIVIKDSKLTLKLGHEMVISNHIHVPPTINHPGIGDIGIIRPPSTGPQITPPLRPLSIANTGASVTPDTSLVKDENLGEVFGDIKTRTIYHYYNIAQIDPVKDEITWQSTSSPSIKTRYLFPYQLTINNTPTEVKIPLVVKVPKKDSYVNAETNGALIANNATISGNLNADAGKVGCFDIYETGLYSDFIELNKDSLVLTGGKFTLSSSNNGDSISLDTASKSDPAIIFSGNGSIVDQTGSVGLRFEAGESKKEITYKAILYAIGTDGWGGNNSITITTKAYDPSSKNWNTLALKKDRTFTIYHKGYDMGDKIRQLTITLKAGEYTKTVEFGGYWTFYGASWTTSDGSFLKNTDIEGSTFTQTEVVPASLYALSSILPQSTGAISGTISVYYNTSYGSPVNDYEYGGTKEISGTNYYVWSGNHGATGHPTEYYTLTTTKPENIITGSNANSTTLYYMKDGKLQDNRDIKSSMYVLSTSITIAGSCSLGSDTAKWDGVYAKYLNSEELTGKVVNTDSDLRLKQNINYDISKYDNLFDSLKPASYQFKSDLNQKTHLGFIAQEVEQSLFDNNLTRKDFAGVNIRGEGFDEKTDTILNLDKTTYALGYNELHALEVRQIQLLKARVQELEAKIEQLIKNKE